LIAFNTTKRLMLWIRSRLPRGVGGIVT
jgi:hypothetical protein